MLGIGENVHKILACNPEGKRSFGVLGIGITFILVSLAQLQFYGLKELCPGVPQNPIRDTNICVFLSHKNTTFQTMRTYVLTLPQWGRTSLGVGQPSTSTSRKGRGSGVCVA